MKNKIAGICSILINILPFLIYPMLITQHNGQFVNFVPFAVYYAFRRAGLLLFRDWQHHFPSLGKIGLFSGLLGSIFGLFGVLNTIFWDISGIGIGLASVLFPTAVNQNKRLMKIEKNDKKNTKLVTRLVSMLVVFAILAVIAIFRSSIINFLLMLIINVMALCTYQYRNYKLVRPVHFNLLNYLLGILLFLSMLSMRIARSTGIKQAITWGIALLGIFLLLMTFLLVANWQRKRRVSSNFRGKAIFYGVCGQYWTIYSTIFIGVLYGRQLYYWVVVIYLLAMILGPLFAKFIFGHIAIDPMSLSLIFTIIGILLTFWLPIYFLGVFLIRTFASQVRQMTTSEYEQQTNNYHLSFIVNYNYATIGGMTSQFVMWGSMLLLMSNQDLSDTFIGFSQHQSSLSNISAINGAHIILAVYMILYTVILLISLHSKGKNTKKITS